MAGHYVPRRRLTSTQNVGKILYNMQYVMSLDPCRRSAFGITIEDTQMRLWFVNRVSVVVSETFDFLRVGTLHFFSEDKIDPPAGP